MELIKLNASEFGLGETKARQIEKSFDSVSIERDGIMAIYQELITSEITPEICKRAGELNTALSKVNASLNRVHKAQKLYYLSGGKFVDAIKNKNRVLIEEMQTNLIALKDHEANELKAKIAKFQAERSKQITKYINVIPETLGLMNKDVWDNFFTGTKANYKLQKEAERKAERQRIEKEKKARDEKKRIIAENERLRLEAIEREKAEIEKEKERQRIANLEAKKREKEAEQRARAETERLKKENEAKRLSEEKERQIRAENEAKLQKEREAREIIERAAKEKQANLEEELRKRAEAESKRLQAIEDAKQSKLNMSDANKVKSFVSDLQELTSKYQFQSEKNVKMYADVGILIHKVINHIEK